MLEEEPRLFFMHFWGVDQADKLARGTGKQRSANVATAKKLGGRKPSFPDGRGGSVDGINRPIAMSTVLAPDNSAMPAVYSAGEPV